MNLTGLTEEEVSKKRKQGKVNRAPRRNSDSVKKIILRNTFTIFNLVNLILALMIISVHSYKNLLFVLIAIANTLISIINEIRAKRTIDKMRLLAEQNPTVIRAGKTRQIPQDEIVEGDLLVYSLGDQVIVDSEIKQGTVEVNEAFITGEQDNILKKPGEKLISGSFIVSGTCKATATAVGEENFINKLESSAHVIKTADSKLFSIMNKIVKYISFTPIPVGVLLLWARFRVPDTTPEIAVTSTVAGLINMIPEGLVLLTSSILALATIRLSRKKILVQDLYSIETLARVDCIALDKTGTLTTGKMTVKDLIPVEGGTKNALENALKLILSSETTNNATSIALKQKLLKKANFTSTEEIQEIIPFSSDRKYSGVKTKNTTYLLGAPEIILDKKNIPKEIKALSDDYRVLAVTKNSDILGFALLEDELRKDAKEIINFFKENDVEVNIISGDNLRTVKKIAEKVGVENPRAIDLSSLKSPIDYKKIVSENNIFTRVKPSQKKSLVIALKKQGKTVAMTGDGVNDILAMKEADCSIAIGEGSDAARRSAKLVLLNSDFSSVPDIIAEGRQSINNLERSATLFLSKTTYATILAVLFTVLPLEYPFAPIEMSLLNFACIGFPGVILALESNTKRIKNKFVKNILQYSVPVGITVSITILILAIIGAMNNFTRPELVTISALVTFAIDFGLIYWISKPLNPLRATLLASIFSIFAIAFLVPFFRNFLDFTILPLEKLIFPIILVVTAFIIFLLARKIMRYLTPKLLKKL